MKCAVARVAFGLAARVLAGRHRPDVALACLAVAVGQRLPPGHLANVAIVELLALVPVIDCQDLERSHPVAVAPRSLRRQVIARKPQLRHFLQHVGPQLKLIPMGLACRGYLACRFERPVDQLQEQR